MKALTIVAILWALLLVLQLVFSAVITDAVGVFLNLFVHWILPLAGLAIGVVGLVAIIRGKRSGAIAIVIVVAGMALFFGGGFRLGRLALFQLRKGHYEHLLAEATRTGEVSTHDGYRDEGPPVRYAFYWQRGILDNWTGVVYDPSGDLYEGSQAEGEVRDAKRENLRMLFGGELFHCEKLGGGWYLCWFT